MEQIKAHFLLDGCGILISEVGGAFFADFDIRVESRCDVDGATKEEGRVVSACALPLPFSGRSMRAQKALQRRINARFAHEKEEAYKKDGDKFNK